MGWKLEAEIMMARTLVSRNTHSLVSFMFAKMPWNWRTSYIYFQFILDWFPFKIQSVPFNWQQEVGVIPEVSDSIASSVSWFRKSPCPWAAAAHRHNWTVTQLCAKQKRNPSHVENSAINKQPLQASHLGTDHRTGSPSTIKQSLAVISHFHHL